MIKKTRNSVTTIEQNSLSIDEACNSFQKIYNEIESTNQILQEMMKQISTVSDVASNMAAVSEEQSASTEEISATVETLAENSNEVAKESGQVEQCSELLATASNTLSEYMSKFKI